MSNKSPQVHCCSLIIMPIQQTISTQRMSLCSLVSRIMFKVISWRKCTSLSRALEAICQLPLPPALTRSHKCTLLQFHHWIRLGTKTLTAFYKLYKQLWHVFYISVFWLKTWQSKLLFPAWQLLVSAKRVCIWGLYSWDHSLQSSSGWVDTAGLTCHTAGSVASKEWGWWFLSFTCWGSAFWNNLWESVAEFQKQAFREHKCELERA